VLAAAHKAVLSQTQGSLVTRTLHSELIYNYSGSKHVSFFFTILSWLQQNMYPPLGITHKKAKLAVEKKERKKERCVHV
jgi:hypothetical protein